MPKENKTIKEIILNYIYIVSKQPILLRDLLLANRQFKEGMLVDPAKLGFRLKLTRAYSVYTGIILAVLIPLSGIFHKPLANLDSHISIIGAVVVTAAIFISFNFFVARMRDSITIILIRKSWKIHFPFFSYDEYSEKIEEIFEQSLKEDISKRELEKYILDNLAE